MSCTPKTWDYPVARSGEQLQYEGQCGTLGGNNNGFKKEGADNKTACGANNCGCYNFVDEKACTATGEGCRFLGIGKCAKGTICTDYDEPTNCQNGYLCCGFRGNAPGDASGNALGNCSKVCNSCGPNDIKIPVQSGSFKEMGVRIYKEGGCNGTFLELIPSIPEQLNVGDVGGPVYDKGLYISTDSQVVTLQKYALQDASQRWTYQNVLQYPSFVVRELNGMTYAMANGNVSNGVEATEKDGIYQLNDTTLIGDYLNNMRALYIPPHLEVDFVMHKACKETPNSSVYYNFSDFPPDPDSMSGSWKDTYHNPEKRCAAVTDYASLFAQWFNGKPAKNYLRAEVLGTRNPASLDGDGAIGCVCPNGILYPIEPKYIKGILIRVRGNPRYYIDSFNGKLMPMQNDPWLEDSFSSMYIDKWVSDRLQGKTVQLIDEPQPNKLSGAEDDYAVGDVRVGPSIAWLMLLYTAPLLIQNDDAQVRNLMRGYRGTTDDANAKFPSDIFWQRYATKQLSIKNVPGESGNPAGSEFLPGSDPRISCFLNDTLLGQSLGTPIIPECTSASCQSTDSYKTNAQLKNDCKGYNYNVCANVIVQDIVGSNKDVYVDKNGKMRDKETGNLVSNVTMNNECVFQAQKDYDYDPETGNVGDPPPYPPVSDSGTGGNWWVWLIIVLIIAVVIVVAVIVGFRAWAKHSKKKVAT